MHLPLKCLITKNESGNGKNRNNLPNGKWLPEGSFAKTAVDRQLTKDLERLKFNRNIFPDHWYAQAESTDSYRLKSPTSSSAV